MLFKKRKRKERKKMWLTLGGAGEKVFLIWHVLRQTEGNLRKFNAIKKAANRFYEDRCFKYEVLSGCL